ncbi:MAG: ATP/GTP-binding protein [Candidatus Bathyarchaeia archaeon]
MKALRTLFIVGMAGSGKSLLTGSLAQFFMDEDQNVITVNLDPGALSLPYNPDVDVRDEINVTDLMDRYGLGPNGALIMAADLIATKVDVLRESIEESKADYVIIDTPGQMELFAFRQSGPFIAANIAEEPKAVAYLFDAPFSSDPFNYVSNLFISAALYIRFMIPQVHVLTKIDMIPPNALDEILTWSEEEGGLEGAIESRLEGEAYVLSRDLLSTLANLEIASELIPVSAKTGEGLLNLSAVLTRIFSGGEEILR